MGWTREQLAQQLFLDSVLTVTMGSIAGLAPQSDTGLIATPGPMWRSTVHVDLVVGSIRLLRNVAATGLEAQERMGSTQLIAELAKLLEFVTGTLV